LSGFLSKIVQANNCMSGIIVYWNSFVNLKLIVKQIINYNNLGGRNWAITESLGWNLRNYRNLGVWNWAITRTCGWDLSNYMIFGGGKWTITGTLGWELNTYRNFGVRPEPLQELWGWELRFCITLASTTKWPLNPGYCLNLL